MPRCEEELLGCCFACFERLWIAYFQLCDQQCFQALMKIWMRFFRNHFVADVAGELLHAAFSIVVYMIE